MNINELDLQKLRDILSSFDQKDKMQLANEIQLKNITEDMMNELTPTEKFRLGILIKLKRPLDPYKIEKNSDLPGEEYKFGIDNSLTATGSYDKGPETY